LVTKRVKIVVVDMSSIPFDVRNSVISLILRCMFDFAYWFKKVNSKAYPISVFCDEAHIYFCSFIVAKNMQIKYVRIR